MNEEKITSRVKHPKKRRKLRFRKWVIFVFLIFFLTIFIFSIIKITSWFFDNNKTNNLTDDIIETTKIKEIEDNENTEIINPPKSLDNDYWNYIKMNLLEVDFTELLNKNPDTVAWIQVKGTNINYPVVQTTNNTYYLNHAFDKTSNEAGWVFMDYRNDSINFDSNTILYAHSRINGTMFGSLKNIFNSN